MTPEEQAIVDAVTAKLLPDHRYVTCCRDGKWHVVDLQTGATLFCGISNREAAETAAFHCNAS